MSSIDYGLDAPPVIRNMTLGALFCITVAILSENIAVVHQFWATRWIAPVAVTCAAFYLFSVLLMVFSSRIGKLRLRDALIASLNLTGDERVLDVGSGRGLLLIGAAKKLTDGMAVGLDLWRNKDQRNNTPHAAQTTIITEQVSQQTALTTADMRDMPYVDNSFDAIISCLAIHNVSDKKGRKQAITEIARVAKPGGKLALLDFRCTKDYENTLKELGWRDVRRSPIILKMYPPVRIVYAVKPTLKEKNNAL